MSARGTLALVLGAPASRQQFKELACAEQHWDYGELNKVCRDTWEARFDALYAPAAGVIAELCQLCEERGYTVYERATLSDFGSACAAHAIVIVFAHWKSSRVLESDLLQGWENALLALVSAAQTPFSAELAQLLTAGTPNRRQVRDKLNGLISSARPHSCADQQLSPAIESSPSIIKAAVREILDIGFAGRLRQGNCLELYDGLHRAAQIADVVGNAMPDVLDLSCCRSAVLATCLRKNQSQRIINGEAVLMPAPQLRMVHWILSHLGPDLDGYADARLVVARALRDSFRYRQDPAQID